MNTSAGVYREFTDYGFYTVYGALYFHCFPQIPAWPTKRALKSDFAPQVLLILSLFKYVPC
jgi:hypothetical protein